MAMDKINGSPIHQSGILDRFQGTKTDKNKEAKDTGVAAPQSSSSAPTTDKAEISETAHKLMDLRQAVDTGRVAMDQLPDVRQEKVALAKQRMAEGFYQSPEVQQQVAEKLGSVLDSIDEI
jgi:hypothetical protein